jgi:hypothetical protein
MTVLQLFVVLWCAVIHNNELFKWMPYLHASDGYLHYSFDPEITPTGILDAPDFRYQANMYYSVGMNLTTELYLRNKYYEVSKSNLMLQEMGRKYEIQKLYADIDVKMLLSIFEANLKIGFRTIHKYKANCTQK